MKHLVLPVLLFCGNFSLYAQQPDTTGGCHLWGDILSIVPAGGSGNLLENGYYYTVFVSLGYDCSADLTIKLNDIEVGKLINVDDGEYAIPLKRLNVPAGIYTMYYYASAYDHDDNFPRKK